MKIVVAGGSGLIGRYLVRELVERGEEPVVLSRSPTRARRVLPPAVAVEHWQPAKGAQPLAGVLRGCDAVVNLAGASVGRWPWTASTKREIRESRLAATGALVGAIALLAPDQRPMVLLSGSGTHMYEDLDAEPATETTPPTGDNFLGRLCLDWEAAALRARELGVRVALLRTSLVVAHEAPALGRMLLPFRLFSGGRLGSGRQWVSWVAIEDAAGLIVHALRAWDVCGPVNLAAPDPVQQRDFARIAGRVLRRPAWPTTPTWLVRLALGEQATLALGSRRVWPAAALRSGYRFKVPSLESALRAAAGDGRDQAGSSE